MGMTVSRVVAFVVATVIGAVYGVAGTIGHATMTGPIPVGLLVALVGSAALLLAIRLLTRDRWLALAAGIGMTLMTLIFSGRGPGGSVVVPAGVIGTVWTFAVPLVVALVVAWPTLRGLPPAAASEEELEKREVRP